jgi:peptide/nickel transport system permease protein
MMLLLVVALFGPSIPVITFVIAIAQWPEVARLTRSLVLVEREKPYVAAARVLGLTRMAILVRHVIPNIVKQASLVVLLLLAQAVLLESSLSYLGAGPQRPFATWGRIIADGQDYITTSWWIVTLTGLMIVLLVVGVNLLGDGLRDRPAGSKRLGASLFRRGGVQKAKA